MFFSGFRFILLYVYLTTSGFGLPFQAWTKKTSSRLHQSSWEVTGLNQNDLMYKDECLIVNGRDEIVGHASKYDAHRFTSQNKEGLLHRAFSVFLFNSDGKLLLQKRASSKITFPDVWTNTCCSHPLYGYSPSETDGCQGVKIAAVRKLRHELGITQSLLENFKYITRLHYCAADEINHGSSLPTWGEHEVDYILFARANVAIDPNAEEVAETVYVTPDELREMLDPTTGNLWSPWFRIIAERFLFDWWKDLDRTLLTDDFVDGSTIHKF